ncbi:hypothetical protein [Companilactobacillus sp.]|uniref:hypothetical protein n=1 Tax=Companilactobacillus sp. TaxID=2767905 RepID=UPI0025BAD96C|nr:hypothetical protein [Companilactobacillus sp.]MCH4009493.1 hypothetical protein [Companilactobacillus sp.]MCH4052831.1 hypothetical protein [Companilactobacillus sp.]MCH4077435.1 hypothetical protein [Companilactobacillus sp.]MCH4126011.1 hypothetical protein [Companilactobacillus sp.]MCI1311719.1 hypothetical protein [Companilactobacillus sp.]
MINSKIIQEDLSDRHWIMPFPKIFRIDDDLYIVDFLSNWKTYFFPFFVWHMNSFKCTKVSLTDNPNFIIQFGKANQKYMPVLTIFYYICQFMVLRMIGQFGYAISIDGEEQTYWVPFVLIIIGIPLFSVTNKIFISLLSYFWGVKKVGETIRIKLKPINYTIANPINVALGTLIMTGTVYYLMMSNGAGTDTLLYILSALIISSGCILVDVHSNTVSIQEIN